MKTSAEILRPDAESADADWTKRSWDLPPYKSPEFDKLYPDLDTFRKRPVYQHAVAAGLIVDDEWAGPDSDDDQPDEE
jgi:hypothetical protein